MEELTRMLEQIVFKLDDISDSLREISSKLDNVSGIYSLDDIAEKIDEASSDVRGETGYNLTDIHNDLQSAVSELQSIGLDISLKD